MTWITLASNMPALGKPVALGVDGVATGSTKQILNGTYKLTAVSAAGAHQWQTYQSSVDATFTAPDLPTHYWLLDDLP